jgi:hypothetical protein|tara:strand:+ start:1626 stop:1793 length:168 start_codon:yes stop_codon:yes gene_type:complete
MNAKNYAKNLVNCFYNINNNYPEKSLDYFDYEKSIIEAKSFLLEIKKEINKLTTK